VKKSTGKNLELLTFYVLCTSSDIKRYSQYKTLGWI